MQLFKAQELMAVVVGNEDYDWEALEGNAEYKGGYSSGDQTVNILSNCTVKFKNGWCIRFISSELGYFAARATKPI